MPIEIKVPDMACSACADKIVDAIRKIAPHAITAADPETKLVIVTGESTIAQIKTAIIAAGYSVAD